MLAAVQNAATDINVVVEPTYHRHAFPDIRVNGYGVEVKYSKRDTWNAVGNSVFETMRDPGVDVPGDYGKALASPTWRPVRRVLGRVMWPKQPHTAMARIG